MASGDRQNTNPANSGLSESPSSPSKKDRAKTGKAGSSKKMTKKEQSERFKEAARELGVDESGESFERAFARITRKDDV